MSSVQHPVCATKINIQDLKKKSSNMSKTVSPILYLKKTNGRKYHLEASHKDV